MLIMPIRGRAIHSFALVFERDDANSPEGILLAKRPEEALRCIAVDRAGFGADDERERVEGVVLGNFALDCHLVSPHVRDDNNVAA